jgi:hypothetical protein
MQGYTVYFIWKLLYMFRVVPPPIIRSAYKYIYSIWYLSDSYCYLPRQRQIAVTVWQIPDDVDTVVYAPDYGWRYHPKHVEQFPDKINCVTLHLVGYILETLMMHGSINFKFQILTSITLKHIHTVCNSKRWQNTLYSELTKCCLFEVK